MYVKRNTLLLLACLVWSAAGINILHIGLEVYPPYITAVNLLLSVLVFVVFQCFVFGKLVKKHTARILSYLAGERRFFLQFFDRRSFAVMAFMMALGIVLRAGRFAPEVFIAVFYTGLGATLLLAGLLFGRTFILATLAPGAAERCFKEEGRQHHAGNHGNPV